MSRPGGLESLTPTQWKRLESLADDLERACRQATGEELERIDLRGHLTGGDELFRVVALHELIKTHLEIRWRRNKPLHLDAYLDAYPELGTLADLPAALIYEEYRVRNLYGDKPALAAYRERFPGQFAEVEELLEKQPLPVASPAATTPVNLHNTAGMGPGLFGGGAALPFVGKEYKLLEHLGEGTFGDVYKAESTGGVLVAIKRLRYPIDKAEAQSELKSLELIKNKRHAYLLATHAYWIHDNRLHIAMELADGTLRTRLRQCQLLGEMGIPAPELVKYFHQAAELVDYLHDEGILHRDIKPENILLLGKNVKVGDLGLARLVESVATSLTGAPGTPLYMGPELWRKKPVPAKKSDLYALAVTYGELRMGRRVFQGSTVQEIMFSHLDDLPDLSPLGEAEKRALLNALAKDPAQRQRNCQAFLEELEEALWEDGAMKPRASAPEPRSRLHKGSIIEGGYQLIEWLDDDEWRANSNAGSAVNLCFLGELNPAQRVEAIKSLLVLSDVKHPNLLTPSGFWLRDAQGQVIRAELGNAASPSRLTLVIASELSHPNIWVKLRERVGRDQPLPAADILPYLRQVAAALDYLNLPQRPRTEAILHCALRPECILITEDDRVKVCDFRMARVLDGESARVELPEKRLRSGFCAPELWRQRLTDRTDQFALAVVYYQLRTGRMVDEFKPGEKPSQIELSSGEYPLHLEGVSEAERTVLSRALAVDPGKRYPSCHEFIAALDQTLDSVAATTRTPRPADKLPQLVVPPPPAPTPPLPKVAPTPPAAKPAARHTAAQAPAGTLAGIEDGLTDSQPWDQLVAETFEAPDPTKTALSKASVNVPSARQTALPAIFTPQASGSMPAFQPAWNPTRGKRSLRNLLVLGIVLIAGVGIGIAIWAKFAEPAPIGETKPEPSNPATLPQTSVVRDPKLLWQADYEAAVKQKRYAHARAQLQSAADAKLYSEAEWKEQEARLHAAFEADLLNRIAANEWDDALEVWDSLVAAVVDASAREAMQTRIFEQIRKQFWGDAIAKLESKQAYAKALDTLQSRGVTLQRRGIVTAQALDEKRTQLLAALAFLMGHQAAELCAEPISPDRVLARLQTLMEQADWTNASRLFARLRKLPAYRDRVEADVKDRLQKARAQAAKPLADAQEKALAAAKSKDEPAAFEAGVLLQRLDAEARAMAQMGAEPAEESAWRTRIFLAWLGLPNALAADKPELADAICDKMLAAIPEEHADDRAKVAELRKTIAQNNLKAAVAKRVGNLSDALAKNQWPQAQAILKEMKTTFSGNAEHWKLVLSSVQEWAKKGGADAYLRAPWTDKTAAEVVAFALGLDLYNTQPAGFTLVIAKCEPAGVDPLDALILMVELRKARDAKGPELRLDQPDKDADAKAFLATLDTLRRRLRANLEKALPSLRDDDAKLIAALDDLQSLRDRFAAVEAGRGQPLAGDAAALDDLYRLQTRLLCGMLLGKEDVAASAKAEKYIAEALRSLDVKSRLEKWPLLVSVDRERLIRKGEGQASWAEELTALDRSGSAAGALLGSFGSLTICAQADAPGYPRYLAALLLSRGNGKDLEKALPLFAQAFRMPPGARRWNTPTRRLDALAAGGELAKRLKPAAAIKTRYLPAESADAALAWLSVLYGHGAPSNEAGLEAWHDLRIVLALAAAEASSPDAALAIAVIDELENDPKLGWAKLQGDAYALLLTRARIRAGNVAATADDLEKAFVDFRETERRILDNNAAARFEAADILEQIFTPAHDAIDRHIALVRKKKPEAFADGEPRFAAFYRGSARWLKKAKTEDWIVWLGRSVGYSPWSTFAACTEITNDPDFLAALSKELAAPPIKIMDDDGARAFVHAAKVAEKCGRRPLHCSTLLVVASQCLYRSNAADKSRAVDWAKQAVDFAKEARKAGKLDADEKQQVFVAATVWQIAATRTINQLGLKDPKSAALMADLLASSQLMVEILQNEKTHRLPQAARFLEKARDTYKAYAKGDAFTKEQQEGFMAVYKAIPDAIRFHIEP